MNGLEFARKYGIKARVKFVDNVSERVDPEGWPHTLYKVKMWHKGKLLTTPYKMGIAHTSEPELAEVLLAISSDSRAGNQSFEEYCDEFGLDADSLRDHRTWKACRKMKDKAYAWCSSEEMFEDFLGISE